MSEIYIETLHNRLYIYNTDYWNNIISRYNVDKLTKAKIQKQWEVK